MNINDRAGQSLVIAAVGALMITYVLIGGMRGTTYVQIIKAILLIGGAVLMTVWVLAKYGMNFSDLLGAGAEKGAALEPGAKYGLTNLTKLDFISLALALVLGTAGLPHILMRFYTVPTAKEARKSVVWAIWLIGLFYLLTLTLGYGAAAMVGPDRIAAAPGAANSAAPLLAYELGGTLLLGLISAVAFATILAVVAGLTITAWASFAHDIYASVIHKGNARGGLGGPRRPNLRRGGRRDRDPRRDRGQRAEHRVPGCPRLRRRRLGEPPDDPLLAVLEAVQHPWLPVEHLRRSDHHRCAYRVLAGGVGQQDGDVPQRRLVLVPAGHPRSPRDPSIVPARVHRLDHEPGAPRVQGRRDGGPVADRCRRGREGRGALTGARRRGSHCGAQKHHELSRRAQFRCGRQQIVGRR
jgi:hypothetical protein